MKQELFSTREYLHPELTDIALARFAGLFIGEGCIGVYNNSDGSYLWRAQIGMTCAEDITADLKRFFGGHVNLESREKKARLPLLYWQVNNQEAAIFIKAILPFMCWKLKRDQSIIFLESFEEYNALPRRSIGRGLTERARAIAEQAKKDIAACK
jgi:hypothetical protein